MLTADPSRLLPCLSSAMWLMPSAFLHATPSCSALCTLCQDRSVIVLCNLKPRNMRGIKSNGMLLCASDAAHEHVEPLTPPEGAAPGERVFFGDGGQDQPEAESPNKVSVVVHGAGPAYSVQVSRPYQLTVQLVTMHACVTAGIWEEHYQHCAYQLSKGLVCDTSLRSAG